MSFGEKEPKKAKLTDEAQEYVQVDMEPPVTPQGSLYEEPNSASDVPAKAVQVITWVPSEDNFHEGSLIPTYSVCAIKQVDRFKKTSESVGFTAGLWVHNIAILIDTGADISMVDSGFVHQIDKMKDVKPLTPKDGRIHQFDPNSPIRVIGRLSGVVIIAGNEHKFDFFVPAEPWTHGKYSVIVGTDLLRRMGEFRLNLAKQRLVLIDPRTKAHYVFKLENNKVILFSRDQAPVKRIGCPDGRVPAAYVPGYTTVTPSHKELEHHSWASAQRSESAVIPAARVQSTPLMAVDGRPVPPLVDLDISTITP
jgi:hypothetical protein